MLHGTELLQGNKNKCVCKIILPNCMFVYLVGFIIYIPAMAMSDWSVHLTIHFSWSKLDLAPSQYFMNIL